MPRPNLPVNFTHSIQATPALDGLLVPLSAEAMADCLDLDLDHAAIDDIVDRRSAFSDVDAYLRWQANWFREVDDAIGGDGVTVAAAHLLKTPIDSIVVAARLLLGVTSALQPSRVHYVGPVGAVDPAPFHHGHLQFWPRLGDATLASRLLPAVAESSGVPYSVTGTMARDRLPPAPATMGIRKRLSSRLGPLRFVRPRPRRAGIGRTLFTWSGGYGLPAIVRDECGRGGTPLVLQRGRRTSLLGLGPLGYRPLHPPVDTSRPLGYGQATTLPSGVEALVRQIDTWARIDGASSALLSRVAVFVSLVAPAIRHVADELAPHLNRFDVERVIAANPWSIEEFGVLVAAERLGLERVLYQHGDHVFSYDAWLLTETQNFDVFKSSDPTVPDDLREGGQRLGLRTPTVEPGRHRTRRLTDPRREGPICYVPSMMMGDTSILPLVYFDDAWYHRWQRMLLGFMASRPDATFVWKGLPGSNQAHDPIPDLLGEGHSTNVVYEARPFPVVLAEASRVIVDFPSTPLYEAVAAGVPTLAIAFPSIAPVRSSTLALFDGVLTTCEDETTALTTISSFVDARWAEVMATASIVRNRLARWA